MVENFRGAVLATLYMILGFTYKINIKSSYLKSYNFHHLSLFIPSHPHPSLSLSFALVLSHTHTDSNIQPFYVLVDQVNDVDKNETAFSGL